MFAVTKKPNQGQTSSKKDNTLDKLEKKWQSSLDRLQGSKFRMLNEQIYTSHSSEIQKHFQNNKADFKLYHDGFTTQMEKWPENPIINIIRLIEESDEFKIANMVICDLGCGDGKFQEHFQKVKNEKIKKIYSYDLVAVKPFITECDIAHLPLKNERCHVAIFSLALMGKNYLDYLGEAFRVLKVGGYLIIAEVKSRMVQVNPFVNLVTGMGFKILKRDEHNTHFILLVFKKMKQVCQFNGVLTKKRVRQVLGNADDAITNWQELGELILKPCLYKKR